MTYVTVSLRLHHLVKETANLIAVLDVARPVSERSATYLPLPPDIRGHSSALTTAQQRLFSLVNSADNKMRTIIHRRQWESIAKIDPRLTQPPFRYLLNHIVNYPRTEDGCIPANCYLLSRVIEQRPNADRRWRIKNMNFRKLLRELASISGMEMDLSGYDFETGEATEIRECAPGEALSQVLYPHDANALKRQGLIDMAKERPLSSRFARRMWEEKQAAVNDVNQQIAIDEVQDFSWYLNNVLNWKTKAFIYQDQHIQNCLNYIHNSLFDRSVMAETPQERRHWYAAGQSAMAALKAVVLWPQTLYTWSPRTPRLINSGYGLPSLPTELRRLLVPYVVELDLVSAQLACFAKMANIQEMLGFLAANLRGEGPSWWEYLYRQLGIDDPQSWHKDVLKRVTYALTFGMASGRLFLPKRSNSGRLKDSHGLVEALKRFTPSMRERFYAIPLVQLILTARQKMIDQAGAQGHLSDAWGREIHVDFESDPTDPFDAKSVLAYVAQSWEMRLLEGARRLTLTEGQGSHGWQIVCWQHDGFSLSCRESDAETICKKLDSAVRQTATDLGIPTALECKYDGVTENCGLQGRRFFE